MAQPTEVDYGDHNLSSTLFSTAYTISYDKYSCVASMYPAHVVFSYLVFLTGLACLVTRCLPPRLKAAHSWLGRAYIVAMLWATATSLLINNTGLPLATLYSFAASLIGLTIAWALIIFHRARVRAAATRIVQAKLDKGVLDVPLSAALDAAVAEHTRAQSFKQRFFSLKAAHGALFFMSWFNIAGRVFATPGLTRPYECHTYPAYKPLNTSHHNGLDKLALVPANDPNYSRLPWARIGGNTIWTVVLVGGTLLAGVIALALAAYFGALRDRRKIARGADLEESTGTGTPVEVE